MNKILISNFPYPSQEAVFQKIDTPSVQVRIVHGFESPSPLSRAVICPRIARDILQAILIHDRVSIELHEALGLLQVFGFSNTIKLLQSGCFELIDHNGFNPVLARGDSNYGVIFLQDSDIAGNNKNASLNLVEKRLREKYPAPETETNLLMLQIERNRHFVDLTKSEDILKKEIDFDLQNRTLVEAYNISSRNHGEINPADIYKILRLLFINKSLFLSNVIGAVAVKVDGEAKSVLQRKISPIVQSGNTHDPVSIFQDILREKGIPDLSELYIAGVLTIEDILSIREDIHGAKFREWFLTAHYDPETVRQTLLSKGVPQAFATKLIRFIVPNAIGIMNVPLGLAASAIDSFLIDKIFGGWHPSIFLDDVLRSEIDTRVRLYDEKIHRDFIKSRFPNVGRNDRCPCGSGKKFKRCCGGGI